MRVLILSSINGGGHGAAAQALKECFELHGDAVVIEDCLSFISSNVSGVIAKSHNFMYRHAPKMIDIGYRQAEKHPKTLEEHHNVRRVLSLGCRQMGQYIRDEGFEVVICTHVFAALMLTDAKKRFGLHIHTGVVETDYTATPGAQAGELDWHFIPAPGLVDGLAALGVRREKIIPCGIPLRTPFYGRQNRSEARQALNLPEDCRHMLVMGGSMGAGPLPEIVSVLIREMDQDTRLTVVCGTRRSLMDGLRAVYSGDKRIRVLGYADNVAQLMDSADLLVTKPGGITVTEAMVKRLPMVLVNTVAGCEAYNLDFFVRSGGAATADTPEALATLALRLLWDPVRLERMAADLEPLAKSNDREVIYRTLRG